MTYMLNGKQYIVVAISGGNYAASCSRSGCRVGLESRRSTITSICLTFEALRTGSMLYLEPSVNLRRGYGNSVPHASIRHREDIMRSIWQSRMNSAVVAFAATAAMLLTPATIVLAQGAADSGAGTVTFSRDVAPILQKACQNCHRPGMMAPMSLLTYQDARPWARSIKTKVVSREMPPWFIDRHVGIQKFKNDPSLSDAEIADDREVGRRRRAAGQSGRHAEAARVRRDVDAGTSKPDADRQDAEAVRAEGARRRRVRRRDDRSRLHGRHVRHGDRDAADRHGQPTRSFITRPRT